MNRKQYFAIGWFFLIFSTILTVVRTIFFEPLKILMSNTYAIANSVAPSSYYIINYYAIQENIAFLCFGLFFLFIVLGFLEKKSESVSGNTIKVLARKFGKSEAQIKEDIETIKNMEDYSKLEKDIRLNEAVKDYQKNYQEEVKKLLKKDAFKSKSKKKK
tara:strand:+ start:1224 stop:1703 length:480 start_codon:yes stop_codon:yes gene_type:complete